MTSQRPMQELVNISNNYLGRTCSKHLKSTGIADHKELKHIAVFKGTFVCIYMNV
jgi:hypothetical protein